MAKTTRRTSSPFGPGDEPGAPGEVPNPDHHIDIPAAPATHPPVPPIVPSEWAIGEFFSAYGAALFVFAAGLVIAVLLLMRF